MADKKTSAIKLLSSKDEAGNVRTFIFETGGLKWIAGQYQKYTLPQAGRTESENERWFTIASAPSEGAIRISTRLTGSAFKRALKALVPSDAIRTDGLEGDFTWEEQPSKPVVFIAAGIGVTPFRSILLERHAAGKKLNATLLYFNRIDEIPFREELEALARQHPELSLAPIVGEPVTADSIFARARQASETIFYLSGPEPMVENIGAALKERGVSLKQDWFPGYDEKNY